MPALAPITIAGLAAKTGIDIESIRTYERMGLIEKPRRGPGGYLLYRGQDSETLTFIRRATALGFSLPAIRDLLDIEFNATEMLPSDGGDFGFDNIATASGATSWAMAGFGCGNSATAKGSPSIAYAGFGVRNQATAGGACSMALAGVPVGFTAPSCSPATPSWAWRSTRAAT